MLNVDDPLQQALRENAQLVNRVAQLEQQLAWFQHQYFGRSTERQAREELSPDQARLFDEAEALAASTANIRESVTIPAYERRMPGRKPLPTDLPRIEVLHDLPADQKICAHDGTPLERIGEETSEQLDIIPAKVRVLRHVRPKYSCPDCRQGVVIAPVPAQLLPKSNASASLLAHIVTSKYVDGLPLHRQEKQLARFGIELPRATMASWMVKLGTDSVIPIVNLLNEQMMSDPLLLMDETPVQVVQSEKAEHYMWVRAAGPPHRRIILFDHDPSRGGAVPRRLLEGYKGILLTGGYEAYAGVAQSYGLVHAGCWAHARRGFEEARKLQPDPESASHARIALDYIGQLYLIEREIKDATSEARGAARATRSAVLVGQFRTWLEAMAGAVLPKGLLGKAVRYTLNQWSKLTVFLTHPDVPLDTNRVENAIRPFVIGRKNWLFSHSAAGATASANLYSLVETAKANGLEPHAYLSHLFAELPKATALEHFEALLPWNMKPAVTHH